MNDSRLSVKVGLFVLVAITILAGLLLLFSKGTAVWIPTYTLRLRAENVGGLKSRSAVLISGVDVGSVTRTELAPDGKSVTIFLKIQKKYRVHRDARFVVEQIGLLGDQYVVIHPRENAEPILKDGDEVRGESPFNLQTVARSTVGFIERVDQATAMLKETIERVNQRVLNDRTLSNLADGVDHFRQTTEQANQLAGGLNRLIATNSPPLAVSLTNLARVTEDLTPIADEVRQTLGENRHTLSNAVLNLRDATATVGRLARDLESGQGVAGGLMRDEELRRTLTRTLMNLETASSNVANYGLLFKPRKPPKK